VVVVPPQGWGVSIRIWSHALVLFCGGVGGVVLLDAVVGGSWFCFFAVVWYWFFASAMVLLVLFYWCVVVVSDSVFRRPSLALVTVLVVVYFLCLVALLQSQSPVVVQLLHRLSSLSLSRKPPRCLNLYPKHFFAAILALYVVAFMFCFWSLVAIVLSLDLVFRGCFCTVGW
jgi:hypothetical protein